MIGPFDKPPFKLYRINPLAVAEGKYSGKKRLIIELSAPHNDASHASLNDLIDKEQFSLRYVKLDDAISVIKTLGHGTKLCKFDIANAFKLCPMQPDLVPFYGVQWNSLTYYFTKLCFGSRSSPALFNLLADAVCWIAKNKFDISCILHLLDDFLTIDSPDFDAERTMAIMTMIFHKLGIPLAQHKTLGPVFVLEYLGIILDTLRMEARLPPVKLERLVSLLQTFKSRTSCTKQELLSLLGHLYFASRVVVPGRSFVSYLFFGHFPDQMMKAACTTAFFGFLRCGEFTASSDKFDPQIHLCLKDVVFDGQLSKFTLTLKRSKTDIFICKYYNI